MPAKALDKKALWKDITREERAKVRKKIAALKARVRDARAKKRAAFASAGAQCRAGRDRAIVARALAKEAIAKARAARLKAREGCKLAPGHGALVDALRVAREHLRAEEQAARELRAIERSAKSRRDEDRTRSSAHDRKSESDDEVRANIPPELVGLFNRVRRSIKGSPRKSRTEAFLEYAEAHPSEAFAGVDDEIERMIAAHEAELRRANPKKKRRRNGESPRETYRRTHWGQEGRAGARKLRVADPHKGPIVELGRLRRVEYETDKGDGVQVFFHDFGRAHTAGVEHGRPKAERCPVLAFTREGLIVAGGNYSVRTEGIVG